MRNEYTGNQVTRLHLLFDLQLFCVYNGPFDIVQGELKLIRGELSMKSPSCSTGTHLKFPSRLCINNDTNISIFRRPGFLQNTSNLDGSE